MPAYGSIEHPEPRLPKTNFRMAIAVLSGMLLLVAVAGAIQYVKFHQSLTAAVGTKLFHDSHEHLALEQLTASLDRQLQTLNQLEAKVLPIHSAKSAPALPAAAAQPHPVTAAAIHGPEGKSESFLADIMGIQSPAMQSQHPQLVKSFESRKGTEPSSSSNLSLFSGLFLSILLLLGAMF